MSKLYGSICADNAPLKTRTAHHHVTAHARSWEGSIIADVWIDDGGTHWARVEVGEGSTIHGRTLWEGKLAELLAARELVTR